jgi:hypothetical protein
VTQTGRSAGVCSITSSALGRSAALVSWPIDLVRLEIECPLEPSPLLDPQVGGFDPREMWSKIRASEGATKSAGDTR